MWNLARARAARGRCLLRPSSDERSHPAGRRRSEEHTSELQSPDHLVCRLLLEKKKQYKENGILITLQGMQRVRLTEMGILAYPQQLHSVQQSVCFRCSFEPSLNRGVLVHSPVL